MEPEMESAPADVSIPIEKISHNKGSIFRAPFHIRYSRYSDFEPKLVSIGPYFHGQEHLLPMEPKKLKCMSDIVGSDRPPEDVADLFKSTGWRTFDCYKDNVEYSDEVLLRMLVRDSFFIIRIILLFSAEVTGLTFLDVNTQEVRSDLLLLENQIPLELIIRVYEWIKNETTIRLPPFKDAIESFICFDMPWKFSTDRVTPEASHLLDFYWRCSLPHVAPVPSATSGPKVIPNATALELAGVKFEKHTNYGLDVRFSKGMMQMPCLKIDPNQTKLLVNLIAFENPKLSHDQIFNCLKMDELVCSENDVDFLQKCGVIDITLSSNKMAVTSIKKYW